MPISLGDIEFKSVQKINTAEKRKIDKHRVPQLNGEMIEDRGRYSAAVELNGIFYGTDSKKNLEEIRKELKKALPLAFSADIIAGTDISEVLFEKLKISEFAGKPDQFKYSVRLREHIPEPEPDVSQEIENNMNMEAENFMSTFTISLDMLPDIIPLFMDILKELQQSYKELTGITAEL